MRRLAVVAILLAALPAGAATQSDRLELPRPTGKIPLVTDTIVPPERKRESRVPGPVEDTERFEVLVDPTGAVARLLLTQRLVLTGRGDFVVRERGPALRVTALEDTVAPIIQRGAVVWQGFVPDRKLLAARIELDPLRETPLLPLRVQLTWSGTEPIGTEGGVHGPGRLTVRFVNQTGRGMVVPTGDVDAAHLAGPLDALLAHALQRGTGQPPAAGRGLPTSFPARGVRTRVIDSSALLRVDGTVRIAGATGVTVSGAGAGATPTLDGAVVAGVLHGETKVVLDVPAGDGQLEIDLRVVPSLDPRTLRPPTGRTWSEWAETKPNETQRRRAVDVLVAAAAAAARDDEVAPYLGHAGPGPVSTEFRYTLAPPPDIELRPAGLTPKPWPITLACIALLLVTANCVALWRRL